MAKIDPLKGPLTRPVIVRENEGSEQGATHRGGGRRSKILGFYDPENGISIRDGLTTYTPERLNPRHRHIDEAIRYYLRGAEVYGKDVLNEGDCVYVPEGVYYGPTRTADGYEENVRLSVHFPGPSGHHTPVWPEIMRAQREMREKEVGKFEKGIFMWPGGRKQDAFEAVQEYLTGAKVTYPTPRYQDYIIMRPANFPCVPLEGVPGVYAKHLGYFNEVGPNIKLVKMDPGAKTPTGMVHFLQVRHVIEGEVVYEGESYNAVSCMFFPADAPYSATSTGATMHVVQLGALGKPPLPSCLI